MRSYIDRHWIAITSLILLIYYLLMSLQGFDLTDEGFVLVAYQNFFDDYTYANYMNGMYMTALIGGIWEKLFGFGGWYSFRVFNSLIIVSGYIITCYTLKEYWKYKWWIWTGFLLVLFNQIIDHGTLVFHYYTFSAFMNCVIAFLLYRSFKENNLRLLFVSSVVLGLDIFVRLPNLMLCIIPFILAYFSYYYDRNMKDAFKRIGIINAGIIIGIAFSLLILLWNGHIGSYFDSFGNYTQTAQSTQSGHGIIPMLKVYSRNYFYVLLYMSILAASLGGISLLAKTTLFKGRNLFLYVIAACFMVFIGRVLYTSTLTNQTRITILLALAYVLLMFVMVKQHRNKNLIMLVMAFVLISFLQPVGSDGGIGNMGTYSIWGLIPTSIVVFMYSLDNITYKKSRRWASLISVSAILLFLSISLLKANLQYCCRDEGPRFAKVYRIQSLPKANIFTSKERAEEIDSIMNMCKESLEEGSTTLFALDLPALHYLTHTKPFLKRPWPNLAPIGRLDQMIETAEASEASPAFLVRRFSRNNEMSTSNESLARYSYNNKVLDQFIDKNGYRLIWDYGHFYIFRK